MKNKSIIIVLFILFPLVVGLACTCGLLPIGSKKGAETQEPVVVVPEPIIQEQPPVEEIPPTEEIPPVEEVQPVEPEEESIEPGEELVMYSDTWGTKEDEVFVGFLLENKSKDLILTGVEYTISLQDSSGQEIVEDWNIFPTLFPGQKIGIFYQTSLDEDDPPVNNVDISYTFEDSESPDGSENPLTVEKVKIWEGGTWPVATGVVKNADSITYTDVRTSILCFDETGKIIGGGYTYIDFIPGEDQTDFSPTWIPMVRLLPSKPFLC